MLDFFAAKKYHILVAMVGVLPHGSCLLYTSSMLLLGARMDTLRPRQLLNAKLWIVTAVKLLAMPLLVLLAARALGVSGMPLGILVLCSACLLYTSRHNCEWVRRF